MYNVVNWATPIKIGGYKRMKKFLSLIVLFAAVFTLAACSNETYEIALITDKGNIDDKSFNQGSWEGVVAFAEENDISHQYYKPEEATSDAYLKSIDLAVEGGAQVIVTPGYLFEVPIYEAQTKYPTIQFILLDGSPQTGDYVTYLTKDNVASVVYAEEQSGWLAGYAAVKDGFRDLGFMGGQAVPAVQAFGYGFLQGAEYAAKELDVNVDVTYHYTGNFEENDTNKATASTMYEEGVEVIFAAGGSVGKSVMSAATEAGALVIGVDVDQRYDSETVLTSATKGLAASVVQILESIYLTGTSNEYFGVTTSFSAANDGVGLPTTVIGDEDANAFDRFSTFTIADYNTAYDLLVVGTVVPVRTITIANEESGLTVNDLVTGLSLSKVTVTLR